MTEFVRHVAISRKEAWSRRATAIVLRLIAPVIRWLTRTPRREVRRSLWAGTPILTLPVKAKAERLLGIQADTLVFETYYVTSEFRYNLARWNRGPVWWRRWLLPLGVLLWAACRYQRFHFFCNRGILPGDPFTPRPDEMDFLARLGKEIFFYTYGADVRSRRTTQRLGEPNCCTRCPEPGAFCVCDDEFARRVHALRCRYATATFAMGDMVHYTPGSRNGLFFWPIDLERDGGLRYQPAYPDPSSDRPVRIVHAPNHQGFKGTEFLLEAVRVLQGRGCPIELRLVERVPNHEALAMYRSADIVFDQCMIGFHGYFALEAMAMGKPVLVFLREPVLAPEDCPLVNVRPETLVDVLAELVRDRRRLHELGRRGRAYVERHYSLTAFARRLRAEYRDLGVWAGTESWLDHPKLD